MGKLTISGAGGTGVGSDECTATRNEVLKGYKAITKDSDDELIEGTLELTGTAADSQVLSGQTYYNTDVKTKRTGAMANRGAVSQALNAGGSYTIPAGFHNGSGKVTANSLASQTSATATAAQILAGQTAWVNGSKLTGTKPDRGAWSSSIGMNGSVTIPEGSHNGGGKVNGPSVTQRGAWSTNIGVNGSVTIPEGYHNGSGSVGQSISTMGGQTINPSSSQQTVSCSGKYMTGNIIINGCHMYKELNTTITSSSSMISFPEGRYYYVSGSFSFTPVLIVVQYDADAGLNMIYNVSNGTYWYADGGMQWGTVWFSMSDAAYLNTSGFRVPAKYGGAPYLVRVVGY